MREGAAGARAQNQASPPRVSDSGPEHVKQQNSHAHTRK